MGPIDLLGVVNRNSSVGYWRFQNQKNISELVVTVTAGKHDSYDQLADIFLLPKSPKSDSATAICHAH